MAKDDDDWDAFMSSIEEPDEEVETPDDLDEDETPDEEVDDPKKPAKKSKKAAKASKDDDPDDSDDDDPDEEVDGDEDDPDKKPAKSSYKPRLKQFLNDDGSLNAERIEKSYIDNSKETVRINGELEQSNAKYDALVKAIKDKPEAAKILLGEAGAKKLADTGNADDQQPVDPLLAHVKAELDNRSKKDYADFIELNPDAATDPEKAKKIGRFLKIFGEEYRQENNGEFPSMKDGLEAAYRYYGWDLETKKKDDVAIAAKKAAATRHTPNKKTPVTKQKKNELEGFFAKKLGVKIK